MPLFLMGSRAMFAAFMELGCPRFNEEPEKPFNKEPEESKNVPGIYHQELAGAPGFEPGITIPKTVALPLGYAPATYIKWKFR